MKYAAFLRGINVGGHRKIKMEELRQLLTDAGLENVSSYIQSGNLVFDSNKGKLQLSSLIQSEIKKSKDFDVPVIVKTKKEMDWILSNCPFDTQNPDVLNCVYVTMLDSAQYEGALNEADLALFPNDKIEIIKDIAYIQYATKASQSKLTNNLLEKKLKTTCTSRNWKTMVKVGGMG